MDRNRQRGFTLIELLVAMAIASMLMAVVAVAFTGQSKSYNSQQDIISLQQDMRSALLFLANEIRMAGYDPAGKDAKILVANATTFQFSQDLNGDGDTNDANEIIKYVKSGTGALGRATGVAGVPQPVADNIDQLAYQYYLDDNTWTQTPVDLEQIRAVKIMILGHSDRETAGVADTTVFKPPLEPPAVSPIWTPATPGKYHWRMMSLVVQCRNMQFKKG